MQRIVDHLTTTIEDLTDVTETTETEDTAEIVTVHHTVVTEEIMGVGTVTNDQETTTEVITGPIDLMIDLLLVDRHREDGLRVGQCLLVIGHRLARPHVDAVDLD